MRIPIWQVDAFTTRLFGGNPAAVCRLDRWPDASVLQSIAQENNLSETAFFVEEEPGRCHLRWFTPVNEMDLCGHATLATGHVILSRLRRDLPAVRFRSQGGELVVRREGRGYAMDFPRRDGVPEASPPASLLDGLGRPKIRECLKSRDFMFVLDSEEDVLAIRPNFELLAGVGDATLGVIVTAPGRRCDFVSRFFAPNSGVPEDPVTGSAHCTLAPYWAARLGKNRLEAVQLSARRGEVGCEVKSDGVVLFGSAVDYLEGYIEVA
jgi:predicted PhzF superfamily epimerase YddE/YHI9